jgi:putative ABC transport system substrate-binding protein
MCTLIIALSFKVEAQQPTKIPRIGYQSASSSGENNEEAFRQGLRELGYVDGQNIVIEWRFAQGKPDQVKLNAAELVRLKVDVIVTGGAADTLAAKEATSTIPIVMTNEADPIGAGLAVSLPRPGGNITGIASLSNEIRGKLVELLKETLPHLLYAVSIQGPGTPRSAVRQKEIEVVARSLGLKLQSQWVKKPDDLDHALDAISKSHTEALIVAAGPFALAQRKQIVEFAVKNRLPAIYYRSEFVEDGGLMSYNASRDDLARRAATYVDKILKGA